MCPPRPLIPPIEPPLSAVRIPRQHLVRHVPAHHAVHECDVQLGEGSGQGHRISAVGSFWKVDGKDVLELQPQSAPYPQAFMYLNFQPAYSQCAVKNPRRQRVSRR